eukprot:6293348-Prorocentrum_lima.AAC.1
MSASGSGKREVKLYPCFQCRSMLPFFKTIESWRPEHQKPPAQLTYDEEGHIIGDRNERICPW